MGYVLVNRTTVVASSPSSSCSTPVLREHGFERLLDSIILPPPSIRALEQALSDIEDRYTRHYLNVSLEAQLLRTLQSEALAVRKQLSAARIRAENTKGKGRAESVVAL